MNHDQDRIHPIALAILWIVGLAALCAAPMIVAPIWLITIGVTELDHAAGKRRRRKAMKADRK